MRMKNFTAGLMVVLSVGIALFSLRYLVLPETAPLLKLKTGVFRTALLVHAGASLIALAVGPFQFSSRLRQRSPRVHRGLGYVYFGGVCIGGGMGLLSATGAEGGLSTRVGFFLLGLCWVGSGWKALAAIRRGDVVGHREWMVRNFALTFAAVTLRLWLPALTAATGSFLEAYRTVAWLCWVPNAIVAEILLRSGSDRRANRG